jgi:hypothetical protein
MLQPVQLQFVTDTEPGGVCELCVQHRPFAEVREKDGRTVLIIWRTHGFADLELDANDLASLIFEAAKAVKNWNEKLREIE